MTQAPSLVRAGGWPFLISGAIGRMPAATLQLGLLMYTTGSGLGFAVGGLTVAAVGLGTAVGSSFVGWFADRFGPLPVVGAALVAQTLGILAMIAAVTWWPVTALVLVIAAVIGASNPQVGPIARAHWSTLARQRGEPHLVRVALGYEGACDEVSFVVGPAVSSLLVGLLGPNPAMWTILVFTWVGEGVFVVFLATRRRAEREAAASGMARPLGADPAAARLRWGRVIWPLLACLSVGMVFGSTQTTVTAVNDAAGTPELSGVVYAFVGVGSAIMSMVVVRLPGPVGVKIIGGGVVIAVGEAVMRPIVGPVPHAAVALAIGLGVGAVLVSGFTAIERDAPPARINQAMTFAMMFLTLGIAAGSATSGVLVTHPPDGFWPGVAAGVIAVIAGAVVGARTRG